MPSQQQRGKESVYYYLISFIKNRAVPSDALLIMVISWYCAKRQCLSSYEINHFARIINRLSVDTIPALQYGIDTFYKPVILKRTNPLTIADPSQ